MNTQRVLEDAELVESLAPAYHRTHGAELAECVGAFRRWLSLPDAGGVHVTLAAVLANRAEGDSVWLLHVGPPGCGKTETLAAIAGLADVHQVATLTEAALLSGTPKRDKAQGAAGGLLRTIGDYGILLAKDFGSVLSMHRDARSSVLAALREIYDGAWTRHLGVDGGRTLTWTGKVGLIGACTPSIDTHHAVMGSMGERFVLYRHHVHDADDHAARALAHLGREKQMRAELAAAAARALDAATMPAPLNDSDKTRLVRLATLAVRCRSSVERDSRTREVEFVPDPEAPSRLVLVLARMLAALRALGVADPEAWTLTHRLALDSMPALRRSVLHDLVDCDESTTRQVAGRLGLPTTTVRRALEDLAAHGIATRTAEGKGNQGDSYTLSAFARDYWPCVPEMSDTPITSPTI